VQSLCPFKGLAHFSYIFSGGNLMKNQKVELLAPAGNYDSFIGAINAGADAVYVGGEKFSARAFADNFDTQTLCECIKYAHLFGRKVYLTLNTLIKESEFSEIYEYVKPFYLAGLDGVIIQDFGVLKFLREHFPHMELHASTQMAVTGPVFVSICKELGISRVVPARELSLSELKAIRDSGIEVECFIHGAMCYCYSGMCLMSSILGGRSGNRGKCAQPCRLPYHVTTSDKAVKDFYTLSLKDMCTIEHIPELIEAGIDSFKIEGRMKRSEYAAGVTALYRKYIDRYYKSPEKTFIISKEDKYILEHLYMRSELHDGYLYKHNGKEMVTKDAPSYSGLEENILADIRRKYLGYTQKIPVSIYGYFEVGQECVLTLCTENGIAITVNGPVVDGAKNAPVTVDAVLKQLSKFGGTHFVLEQSDVQIEGDAFIPNGVLNALRREAIELLENAIIEQQFPDVNKRTNALKDVSDRECIKELQAIGRLKGTSGLTLLLRTKDQYKTLMNHSILDKVGTLYLEDEAMEAYLEHVKNDNQPGGEVVYAMPYILRKKDLDRIQNYVENLICAGVNGVLVRNVEELALAKKMQSSITFNLYTDASLYCWNKEAKEAMEYYAQRITLPFELNSKEVRDIRSKNTEQVVYGYIPLMITANCIYKTNDVCRLAQRGTDHIAYLKDRYGKVFTAITNCSYCYNTIYNSVPLSLHKKYNFSTPGYFRLQFSLEKKSEMLDVLNFYEKWMDGKKVEFPIKEYTTAHENRQVE
jgi:putative protease